MAQQFVIRPVTPADVDVIADHRTRMFHEMDPMPLERFEMLREKSRERLRDFLASSEYVGWLASPAQLPNIIAGGAGVQLRNALPHPVSGAKKGIKIADGRHAVIINVFTEPEWRRQGVAGLLLKQILDWAHAEHLDRLVLHASDAGRALYERYGFVMTNEMRFTGE